MPNRADTPPSEAIAIRPKHSFWIRFTHWVHFPVLMVMLLSGLEIYWANRAYTPLIPKEFYDRLGVSHQLSKGLALHLTFMWIYLFNGGVYFCYLMISGQWRDFRPDRKTFREAILVALADLGLTKHPAVHGKFNSAQKIAYASISLMGVLAGLTGLAIYKPIQLHWLTSLFFGYESARLIHFLLAVGFVIFFGIHVGQVIRAGWNQFQAMITGDEVVEENQQKKLGH
jgi:thiosulfate reductase cytochrome b subunit